MGYTVLVYKFKNVYNLGPADIDFVLSISEIPFMFVLIYGVFLDTTKIGNSRRKGFIFIACAIQSFSFFSLCFMKLD